MKRVLLYNSIFTHIFISMHLFTLSKRKIKVHREFLLPWEEINLFKRRKHGLLSALTETKTNLSLSSLQHQTVNIQNGWHLVKSLKISPKMNSSWNQPSQFWSASKFIRIFYKEDIWLLNLALWINGVITFLLSFSFIDSAVNHSPG